jgi:hypothetical protein
VIIHGTVDEVVPVAVAGGGNNDLAAFPAYEEALDVALRSSRRAPAP